MELKNIILGYILPKLGGKGVVGEECWWQIQNSDSLNQKHKVFFSELT